MPNAREYNRKIKTLKNTQKMTKTMKMVSASKLRRAHQAQSNAKQYANHLTGLISRIAGVVEGTIHPLLTVRPKTENILVLVFTSDRGLCGSFNNGLIRQLLAWIKENKNTYKKIDLSFCGKRGFMSLRRLGQVLNNYEGVTANPKFSDAMKIGQELSQRFINKEYDEVYICYNQFFSPLSQKASFQKILPIDPKSMIKDEKASKPVTYIFEPQEKGLLETLIPHYLYFRVYFALLENSAGEHGARMTAMDNATKNAKELTGRYTLLRNRARQAQITTELTEIVAGAEALK